MGTEGARRRFARLRDGTMDLSDVHSGDRLIAVDGEILESADGVVSPKVALATKQMLMAAAVVEELQCRGSTYCGVVSEIHHSFFVLTYD